MSLKTISMLYVVEGVLYSVCCIVVDVYTYTVCILCNVMLDVMQSYK